MRLVLPFAALLLAAACGTPTAGVPADPSYASNIQPIFDAHCVSCHGGPSPKAGYSLASRAGAMGNGSDSLPNVVPGNADSSKLYRKVAGVETPQMPLGRPALDSQKLQTIRNWVNKGAKDN